MKDVQFLKEMAAKVRIDCLKAIHKAKSGHPGGSLSAADILTVLYFHKMRIDPKNPKWPDRDRFILSKGHAAPAVFAVLAHRGFFPLEDLDTFRKTDGKLQGTVSINTPGGDMTVGSLGQYLSVGAGMALAGRMDKKDYKVYVLLGDGEIQEGIVWEAAMSASKFGLDNVIAILDRNGVQLDGTIEEIMPLGDVKAKWESFGWNTIECDGHKVEEISDAVDKARTLKGKPTIIIARTVKGKGVSFMEGKNTWHGKPISREEYDAAKAELAGGK